MLRIFNVGQADSFELLPLPGCRYRDNSLLIDCGQGNKNVFRELKNKFIYLILTHGHNDHIGGLSRLFGEVSKISIKGLWLPYYSDEVAKIANFIFSLKGVKSILGKTIAEVELKGIVNTHRLIKILQKAFDCEAILGVGDGKRMCKHISVYNPPLDPDAALGLEKGTSKSYWEYQKKINYGSIRSWLTKEEFDRKWGDFIAEGWDHAVPDLIKFDTNDKSEFDLRMQFIYGFFYKYESIIDDFVESNDPLDFEKVANAVKLTSNEVSIVLEYYHKNFSCLLTGDVTRRTLRRCLSKRSEKEIQIFKFPHHGSRRSLDELLLEKLNPEIVVISHENGRFGKQIDPHPNIEVIEALERMNFLVAYTNDVIKNCDVVKEKSPHNPYPNLEIVELFS